MRKLDDGTYMYDRDTPWDLLWGSLFIFVAFCLSAIFWSYRAINIYIEDGVEAFFYLGDHGTNSVVWICISLNWAFISFKGLRKRVRQLRSNERSNG